MLDLKQKPRRKPRSFTLQPNTITLLDQLADAYNTNHSRIVETLITQYGPKILAMRQEQGE